MTRVLVVDDDESTRDVIRMLLEEHHFCVSEAGDGDEALVYCARATRRSWSSRPRLAGN